jgi:hypothetical protein
LLTVVDGGLGSRRDGCNPFFAAVWEHGWGFGFSKGMVSKGMG